jgi:hypothetical protein
MHAPLRFHKGASGFWQLGHAEALYPWSQTKAVFMGCALVLSDTKEGISRTRVTHWNEICFSGLSFACISKRSK